MIVVGIPLMVLVAIAAVWLMLAFGLQGDQLDAIRTGGTLGVGLGGVVVLWLAVRRQRSTELDLLQKHQAAQDVREDAIERRITELYTKAVEQLGSDKAPVRLGGLYALERLANNNESQRQTIVNVICAYLRMPYEPATDDEKQVRLTAQRILGAHLLPTLSSYWGDIALDLTEATLIDFDLRGRRLGHAVFDGVRFVGGAAFVETTFTRDVSFRGATFRGSTTFFRAKCAGLWFDKAGFEDFVSFSEAEFSGAAVFDGAMFHGHTYFEKTRFAGPEYALFQDAGFAYGIPEGLESTHLGDGRAE